MGAADSKLSPLYKLKQTVLHTAVGADGTRLSNFLGLTNVAIQQRRAASAVVAFAGEGGSAGRAAQAGPAVEGLATAEGGTDQQGQHAAAATAAAAAEAERGIAGAVGRVSLADLSKYGLASSAAAPSTIASFQARPKPPASPPPFSVPNKNIKIYHYTIIHRHA